MKYRGLDIEEVLIEEGTDFEVYIWDFLRSLGDEQAIHEEIEKIEKLDNSSSFSSSLNSPQVWEEHCSEIDELCHFSRYELANALTKDWLETSYLQDFLILWAVKIVIQTRLSSLLDEQGSLFDEDFE